MLGDPQLAKRPHSEIGDWCVQQHGPQRLDSPACEPRALDEPGANQVDTR